VQLAGDANLAAALKEGQKRHFSAVFWVDWLRDGFFADTLSNLSANVTEWSLEKSLAGVVPDELQTTEGYSTAKITIKLEGSVNGIPMWKLFSPFSGLSYGSGTALNIPMLLKCGVQSPLGAWEVDQITGWIDSAVPDLASGSVTLVCFDGGGQLETGITVDRWGADQYRREVYIGDTTSQNADEASETCTIEAGWLIDSALRRTGFFEGPQWHPGAMHARTLRGSPLPEVGAWNQIPMQDYDPVWQSGMLFSTPHLGPAMQTPGEVWSKAAGKYGPAFIGQYRLTNWKATGIRGRTHISSGTKASIALFPTTYGSNNSNILGWSGWVFVDSTLSFNPATTDQFYLSAKNGSFPSNAQVTINHKNNTIQFQVTNDGGSQTWSWTNALGGNGWRFVSLTWQFTPSQVWGSMWLDGVQVINQTNGGRVGALPVSAYSWIEGMTNSVFLSMPGTMQYTQWINAYNTPFASYQQPVSTPPIWPRQQAKVDLTGQRLLWFPNIEQGAAGDVIKAVTNADLGVFYFTEQGVATFDSRATVKSRQLTVNSVFDITVDNASNLIPVSAYLSVANRIGYTARPKVAQPFQHIYSATKPDQFVVQPGAQPRFNATLSDVQAFRCAAVTVRPFAQGYDVGLSPPTLFWQEYMQHYAPSYWEEGTTLYEPGSQPSNGPPPVGNNASVYALPGWFNIDTNCRHMRLAFFNTNPSTVIQFSINDTAAFLVVGGTLIVERPTVTESVSDATSIARYRERVFNLPADDWHQDILWLRTLGASLLADTKNPTVQFQDIEMVGDPRRQLQDVCRVIHRDAPGGQSGMTGATQAYGSVVGIKRKFTRSGDSGGKLTDTLTIRTFT
jgi:hypothetical protein